MNLRGHLAVIGATTTVWTIAALATSPTPITLSVAVMAPIVVAVETSIAWGLIYGSAKLLQKGFSSAKDRAQQVDVGSVKACAANVLSAPSRYLGNLWPRRQAAANANSLPVGDQNLVANNVADLEQQEHTASRRRSTRKK